MPFDNDEMRYEDSRLINSLAAVQMSFSQYDRALYLLFLSDRLVPGQERTLVLLAHVLFRLKKFQTVLSTLGQIESIRRGPLGKHEHHLKSHTLAFLGRMDEAKSVLSGERLSGSIGADVRQGSQKSQAL